jgi:hypothetical protein
MKNITTAVVLQFCYGFNILLFQVALDKWSSLLTLLTSITTSIHYFMLALYPQLATLANLV